MKKIIFYVSLLVLTVISIFCLAHAYLDICYPLDYQEIVIKYSRENNLDPILIFSTINVESAFNPSAHSSADAIGIMQLQLNTANDMAKKCGDDMLSNYTDLENVELNIKYGCMYIRYLIDYYNNIDNAIVAYNAGMGNVNNWLKNPQYSKDGKNLDTIPFKESENYLKKIKQNMKVYDHLVDQIINK
ncbi:MAG: lytic transglycosylase domain-containing protein [Clostridiales bacterium]|nr:lytic transglycosylase domain-containing protein [Clostridiales bacterium]